MCASEVILNSNQEPLTRVIGNHIPSVVMIHVDS